MPGKTEIKLDVVERKLLLGAIDSLGSQAKSSSREKPHPAFSTPKTSRVLCKETKSPKLAPSSRERKETPRSSVIKV